MSKVYVLNLRGNHRDPTGNPLGYHRQTQRGKYSPKAKDYHNWQNWVKWSWVKVHHYLPEIIRLSQRAAGAYEWEGFDHYELNTYIDFKGEVHADAENVRKGIQDSLFKRDKHVWGKVEFQHRSPPGVTIEVYI